MPHRHPTRPRASPPAWTPPPPGARFPTGANPTPRHKLLAARPFQGTVAPPQFAVVPAKLDMWGNNQYGDCVTAEEGFAKACHSPEIFIPPDILIAWARKNGFLNGADLKEVMDAMKAGGFVVGNQTYDDGEGLGVDFSNESVLQSAISQGNVKIAIDSSTLPSGAGNQQGWYAVGGSKGRGSDHCTGLSGYGTAQYLYGQLGVALPSALKPEQPGYLHFTWSTIGFVDHAWLMNTVTEAWVRNPTTVGVPPLVDPPVTLDPDGWS